MWFTCRNRNFSLSLHRNQKYNWYERKYETEGILLQWGHVSWNHRGNETRQHIYETWRIQLTQHYGKTDIMQYAGSKERCLRESLIIECGTFERGSAFFISYTYNYFHNENFSYADPWNQQYVKFRVKECKLLAHITEKHYLCNVIWKWHVSETFRCPWVSQC